MLFEIGENLSFYRYFNCAYVSWVRAFVLRLEFVCSDADFSDFDIGQESAPDDFGDIDCVAYGFSTCFDVDLFCAGVEQGDAGKDIVHDGFFSDEHRVGLCRL